MLEIELQSAGKESGSGVWLLKLDPGGVVLRDPHGREAAAFAAAEAGQRFRLPNSGESVEDIAVAPAQGEVLLFQPNAEAVRRIRAYLDHSPGGRASKALAALRRRGWLYIMGGVGMALMSVVLMRALAIVYSSGRPQTPVTPKLLLVPIVIGGLGVGRGLLTLRQWARARRAGGT
jgi:hypothetical protein